MAFPRRFWCHAALEPNTVPVLFDGHTTAAPDAAVYWVRESVRQASLGLDRDTFHGVWGWLGDHRAVRAAVASLQQHGDPYEFVVDTPAGRRAWTVHLVAELPLASPCGRPPRSLYAPVGLAGEAA